MRLTSHTPTSLAERSPWKLGATINSPKSVRPVIKYRTCQISTCPRSPEKSDHSQMRVRLVVPTGFPRQAGMWSPINTSGSSSEPAHPAEGNTEPSTIPHFWATEPVLPPQKRIQSRPNKSFHSQRHPHTALPTQICIQAQWPSLGQEHSISDSASPSLWSASAPLPPSRTTPLHIPSGCTAPWTNLHVRDPTESEEQDTGPLT